jgi:hypothetical protein
MSSIPILDEGEEDELNPHELSVALLSRALVAKKTNIPIHGTFLFRFCA